MKAVDRDFGGVAGPKTWQDGFVDSTGVVSQALGERMSRKKVLPALREDAGVVTYIQPPHS
jgi:hypothetical protein